MVKEIDLSQNMEHFGSNVEMSLDGKFCFSEWHKRNGFVKFVRIHGKRLSLHHSKQHRDQHGQLIKTNILWDDTVIVSVCQTMGVISWYPVQILRVSSLSDYAVTQLGGCGYYFKLDSIGAVLNELNVSDASYISRTVNHVKWPETVNRFILVVPL